MPEPFKIRIESDLLKILRSLNTRGELSNEVKKYYLNQEKGFTGEVQFDLLTAKLKNECYILNDLQLEVNNNSFQIDTVMIYQATVYLIDVKNYEGNYYYENENFYIMSGDEIKNHWTSLNEAKTCSASCSRALDTIMK
nr:nuclease-related domain-containing protein [Neobacillus sp. Marseille-Q6967]